MVLKFFSVGVGKGWIAEILTFFWAGRFTSLVYLCNNHTLFNSEEGEHWVNQLETLFSAIDRQQKREGIEHFSPCWLIHASC